MGSGSLHTAGEDYLVEKQAMVENLLLRCLEVDVKVDVTEFGKRSAVV